MNKTAIKNFAVWARNKLIAEISYRAGLMGITENGIAEPLPQSAGGTEFYDIGAAEPYSISGAQVAQRGKLAEAIRRKEHDTDYKTAYKYIMEEVAYTWFNRLIAVRFMEVNDYFPSHIRVLSSETGKSEPDLVTTPFDAGLPFTEQEKNEIIRMKQENKLDEAFRLLFIKQCNALNEILPALFEETGDYTELLLNLSVIDQDGVVWHLVHDIDEEDFDVNQGGQVEIIGWLYQYYNTEPKDETFALLKKNVKVTKERIPSATALFTPDWIVRYMVENSLGRIVISGQCSVDSDEDERICREREIADKFGWKYYIPDAEQTPEVSDGRNAHLSLTTDFQIEDLKIADPCMGSGHILVYAFDVLMQIYESRGYTTRDAVRSILENNLYGLEIDNRAAQLAYFAVMMKARQYDRRIFSRGIQPHVYAIGESNTLSDQWLVDSDQMQTLFDVMRDAKEYGSILTPPALDFDALRQYARDLVADIDQLEMEHNDLSEQLPQVLALIDAAEVLAGKYSVVVTNPPYMGSSNMDAALSEFVKKNYPDSKSDLFAVFIERCGEMTKPNGYQAMITQHAWMFLSSFEKLRAKLTMRDTINMAHLGARAFEEIGGEVVQTTSVVIRNSHTENYKGTYCRLIEPTTQQGKEDMFLLGENRYVAKQSDFAKIPGAPVAYWVSERLITVFENKNISEYAISNGQNITGNNNKYIRLFWEVNAQNIRRDYWVKCARGGGYRKYHGNDDNLILWTQSAQEHYRKDSISRIVPEYIQFRDGITWSYISSNIPSFRKLYSDELFEKAGTSVFINNLNYLLPLLGLLNSVVARKMLSLINPTINYQVRDIFSVPVSPEVFSNESIPLYVNSNLKITKADWDAFETSWDFKRHPLL